MLVLRLNDRYALFSLEWIFAGTKLSLRRLPTLQRQSTRGTHFLGDAMLRKKMELLALGAGAYLAQSLFKADPVQLVENDPNGIFERFYDLNLMEMNKYGAIMPQFGANRGRVPWSREFPPYYIAPDVTYGPMDAPASRTYTVLANAMEHERVATMEQAVRAREHFVRKSGVPLWTAFTREITLLDSDPTAPARTTDRLGFQWMPTNPTDSDWNEAALIGKALPPDPELFTPDSTYMTASGMPFRHGAGTTV